MSASQPIRTISSLDFALFLWGTENEKRSFCEDFLEASKNFGFVKLVNHGIADGIIEELFEWNRRFFSLPLDVKMKAGHPPHPNPHRGYSYIGQEKLSMVKDYEKGRRDGSTVLDIKESFDQGPHDDTLFPNIWVEEFDLPGFRSFMESFYESCCRTHYRLLHALEVALHLDVGSFQNRCDRNCSELRLNHYPACQVEALKEGIANRISEHTDFGTLTLLFQDAVGGLETEDQERPGLYVPVKNDNRTEMIVNVGDCLQRWTNDTLRSASHRVRLPPDFAGKQVEDRYSIAYFGKPNRDVSVGTLPQFTGESRPLKYERITALEYNQAKLIRTY